MFFSVDLKLLVTEALETALPLLTSISVQLHSRLDMIQKHFNLFRTDNARDTGHLMESAEPMPDTLQFEANIVDESNIHARASLYMYLNAAVSHSSSLVDHCFDSPYSFADDLWWMTPP
jgi:hypothetical protein